MACSSCARCTPRSIACACVVSSWVSACATSARRDAVLVAIARQRGATARRRRRSRRAAAAPRRATRAENSPARARAGAQPRRLEIGGARLRARLARLDAAPDPPQRSGSHAMSIGSWKRSSTGRRPSCPEARGPRRRGLDGRARCSPRRRAVGKYAARAGRTSACAWRSWASAAARFWFDDADLRLERVQPRDRRSAPTSRRAAARRAAAATFQPSSFLVRAARRRWAGRSRGRRVQRREQREPRPSADAPRATPQATPHLRSGPPRITPRSCAAPRRCAPEPSKPQAVEIEVHDRRRVERQHWLKMQAADDRDAERPAQLRAGRRCRAPAAARRAAPPASSS